MEKRDFFYGGVLMIFVLLLISFWIVPGGMKIPVTGFATQVGIVNVNVSENLSVSYTGSTVAWGSGQVEEGEDFATLDTSAGTVSGGTWAPVLEGFVVKNEGNLNASVWLVAGKDADVFIGGSGPSYQFSVSNV